MNISPKTWKDIRSISIIAVLGFVAGNILSIVMAGGFSLKPFLFSGLSGFSIALFCAIGIFTFLQRFRHLPFVVFLLVRIAYFTCVTLIVLLVRLFVLGDIPVSYPSEANIIVIVLIVSLAISFITIFVLMLRRMLGQNALLNFFTGRYHKPVEEERIFMFLDISSSTTTAEKIGDVKFHDFLGQFFTDINDAILMAEGEIYKYVGDEVIVSWKLLNETKNNRCIRAFFGISKTIEGKRENYLNKFGFIPHCRAGIHCGPVIVGEMGGSKGEIAFLGDTVNTTSRIQEACKEYKKDLLVSSELLKRLSLHTDYKVEGLGEIRLKGKEKPVELFSMEKP